jgi:hypothetical protein
MYKWYEQSDIFWLRHVVARRLNGPPHALPKCEDETAPEFWERVEKAGLLIQAVELYNQLAVEQTELRKRPRETKKDFEARVEREGRREEADRLRAELLAAGMSKREVHEELVERMQPLDGTRTRPWSTADPWEAGRLFRNKARQEKFQALITDDDDDYSPEAAYAHERIEYAQWRQRERQALRAARRRAYELKQEALVPAEQKDICVPLVEGVKQGAI